MTKKFTKLLFRYARIWQAGFELNSTTANVEFTSIGTGQTIQTTTVRSGTYAGRISAMSAIVKAYFFYQFASAANAGPFFVRAYFNFTTFPSIADRIMALTSLASFGSASEQAYIKIDNTGVLTLFDQTGQIGSASSALNTGQWYCLEIQFNAVGGAGAGIIEGRIDQVVFATSSTRSPAANVLGLAVGGNLGVENQTTGDWAIDDIAINDSTGTSQTSYPGSGQIIHLKPNAAGDSNTFATQTGGTAGSANNFTRVQEVTPDDVTTFNGSSTLNQEDLYNCGNSGLSSPTVNVVAIGFRYRASVASAVAIVKLEIEKTAAGTILQSAAITPNSTTWFSNANAVPRNYPFVTYNDPDSNPWTQTTLDSMQIGMKITTGNTNRADVSDIWASVDYTPGGVPTYFEHNSISQPIIANDLQQV